MKKLIFSPIAVILVFVLTVSSLCAPVIGATSENVHQSTTPYNWYCKKTSDHTQPPLDHLLSFTDKEELQAYYVDKKYTDYTADDKVIYLTFDAGYENGNIEKILDTLKEENVQGAFFVLDNLVKRNTDLVKRMNDEGHLVCNHTSTHPDMTQKTSEEA